MADSLPMQLYSLLIFTVSGIVIGIFFDIFRILRKSFRTSNIVTYIEDFLFWLISGLFFLYILLKYNNGQIRNYVIIGLILGIIIYMLTISKFFIKINIRIIEMLKKILVYPLILSGKIIRPISFIVINIRKNCKIFVNKEINMLKNNRNVKKM